MKQYKQYTLAVLAIGLLAAGCNKTQLTNQNPTPSPAQSGQVATPSPANEPLDSEMGMKDTNQTPGITPATQASTPSTAGTYTAYSPTEVETAQKAGKKVVLFFHADWCPFCIEADKQFKAHLSELPPNTIVLKTNYDTETALKKKYAITYQHTFVQIDTSGNLVSKWNGGDVDNLKKYLR